MVEGTVQCLKDRMRIDKDVATATHEGLFPTFIEDGLLPDSGMRLVMDEKKQPRFGTTSQ